MPFKPITGINTIPGGKKSMPTVRVSLRVPTRRSLAEAALEGRLKALPKQALAALSKGINTRPEPKKGGGSSLPAHTVHGRPPVASGPVSRGINTRPEPKKGGGIPAEPKRPPLHPLPADVGPDAPRGRRIRFGINTTPGGKKLTGW